MTTQSNSLRIARSIAANPYSWPGGYPQYAIADDGAPICHHCCKDEERQIATTTGTDGWCLIAAAVNWEDQDLRCSNCNTVIPSAY